MTNTCQELQKQIVNKLRAGSSGRAARVSRVPIQPDYATNPAVSLTSVVFVPQDTARDITRMIVEPLKKVEPEHHYYAPDSMHLTIKNIRRGHDRPLFTPDDVKRVKNIFSELIPRYHSFTFSLEEIVAFTTSVSLIGYCDERLKHLVQALDAGLNKVGVPDNKQYVSDTVFFGNVTLCRYVHQPSKEFLQAIERMAHSFRGELKVGTIHLITCNSVCSPNSRNVLGLYELS